MNSTFLSNKWVNVSKKKSKGNLKNLEINKNRNTAYQNLWNAAKTIITRTFITINIYIKKKRKISN